VRARAGPQILSARHAAALRALLLAQPQPSSSTAPLRPSFATAGAALTPAAPPPPPCGAGSPLSPHQPHDAAAGGAAAAAPPSGARVKREHGTARAQPAAARDDDDSVIDLLDDDDSAVVEQVVDLTLPDCVSISPPPRAAVKAEAAAPPCACACTCAAGGSGGSARKRLAAGDDAAHPMEIDDDSDGDDAGQAAAAAAPPKKAPRRALAVSADAEVAPARSPVPLAPPFAAAAAAAAAPERPSRRQRRSAFVNAGAGAPRPIVRCGMSPTPPRFPPLDVGSGLSVLFPLPPAPPQVLLMRAAAEALTQGRPALLEAPTGTGKSLALLCVTLAHQAALAATGAPEAVPRVFYVARTHNQLEQMVRELRRTAYRPLSSLLASRERYCLHPPALVRGANRAEECEKATFKKSACCAHLERQEAIAWPEREDHLAHFLPGGALEAADIEDLVAVGHARTICPYHTTRDLLQAGAGLILVTYTQLLSPSVRMANGLNNLLENAVVVWDEAHNVPSAAREAASLEATEPGLAALIEETHKMAAALAAASKYEVPEKAEHLATVARLRALATCLRDWLLATSAPQDAGPWRADSAQQVPGGGGGMQPQAVQSRQQSGVEAQRVVTEELHHSANSLRAMKMQIRKMRAGLIEGTHASGAHAPCRSASRCMPADRHAQPHARARHRISSSCARAP
jgi:hypothetical protein